MSNSNPGDFYFWLGVDGEPEAVTEEEFNKRIEHEEHLAKQWRNVEVNGEGVQLDLDFDGEGCSECENDEG